MAKTQKKTSKSKTKQVNEISTDIAAHFGSRVLFGIMTAKDEANESNPSFVKSQRKDYARIVDIRIPQGYHAQVRKSWEMYELDRIFRYLVERSVDFGANGFEWEVAYIRDKKSDSWLDFFLRVISNKKKANPEIERVDKEKKVWDTWASTINKDVPNVIQGLDEIIKWMIKSFQLNAMAPVNWEWGTVEIDGESYELPIRMTLQNCLSVVLERTSSSFLDEKFWLKLSDEKKVKETNSTRAAVNGLYETPITASKNWKEIPILGTKKAEKSKEQGFVIKYKWSPSDNNALNQGRGITIGQGLYPTPPYVGMYDILMLRRALIASDLAILDGVIHYILDWSIGDNTADAQGRLVNQPKTAKRDASGAIISKSSIQLAKEAITADNRGPVMQLFHPYYYKLEIKTPDVTSLVSTEKYTQSTIELLSGFGILVPPSSSKLNFDAMNTQNFEENVDDMRNTIKRFYESLCDEIVRRNEGKLTSSPNMIFNVLNTKQEKFREAVLNLVKVGKVSTETLLQTHGLDSKIEVARIGKEIMSGVKELNDKNVPVSYKQTATNASGDNIDTLQTPGTQGGRPQGASGKKPKASDEEKSLFKRISKKIDDIFESKKMQILEKQNKLLTKLTEDEDETN